MCMENVDDRLLEVLVLWRQAHIGKTQPTIDNGHSNSVWAFHPALELLDNLTGEFPEELSQ